MRTGALEDLHELAVSIRETGLLHPPLVRETGEEEQPYELLAGQRRFAAMRLLDEADGEDSEDWRFTLVDGISRREALTMQFAENFHQSKPEPVQFARAARLIMAEDPSLTAAEVSRIVGAPPAWTRKALRLLELPEAIVERVERGDLSFTAADFVRRGVARGDVTPEQAEELVEEHANGALSGDRAQVRRRLRPAAAGELRGGLRPARRARRRAAARPARRLRPARSRARAGVRRAAAPRRSRSAPATPTSTATSSAPSSFTPPPSARRKRPADHRRGGRARVRALAAAERAAERPALAGEGSDRSGLIGR